MANCCSCTHIHTQAQLDTKKKTAFAHQGSAGGCSCATNTHLRIVMHHEEVIRRGAKLKSIFLAESHHAAHNYLNCWQFALFSLLLIVFWLWEANSKLHTSKRNCNIAVVHLFSLWKLAFLFGRSLSWFTDLLKLVRIQSPAQRHVSTVDASQYGGFNLCPLIEGQSTKIIKMPPLSWKGIWNLMWALMIKSHWWFGCKLHSIWYELF